MVATQAGRIKRGISMIMKPKTSRAQNQEAGKQGKQMGRGLDETDESMTRQMLCPNFAYLYYAFKVCVIFL